MTDIPIPPPPMSPEFGASGGYPVVLEFERGYEVQNWRPLVNWLLAIPHLIVIYVLAIVASVLWFISPGSSMITTAGSGTSAPGVVAKSNGGYSLRMKR